MAETPLTGILPPRTRAIIYSIYVVVGLVIGGIQVGFAAVPDASVPNWVTIALAVYAYIGVALGGLAASNTNNATTGV